MLILVADRLRVSIVPVITLILPSNETFTKPVDCTTFNWVMVVILFVSKIKPEVVFPDLKIMLEPAEAFLPCI